LGDPWIVGSFELRGHDELEFAFVCECFSWDGFLVLVLWLRVYKS
jgi:hypothetical protein